MQSLELMIVQFEEVKRLIKTRRVPQLRLAHVLLDSVVELLMHRMIQWVLHWERHDFEQLGNLRRHEATGRNEPWLSDEIQRLEGRVVSKAKRKKIERNFGDKIDFLVEYDKLPAELGPVLKKLHAYRNETYHRDVHRVEVIYPAGLIYFDAACTVLEHYAPGAMIHSDALGPELARLYDELPTPKDPFQIPRRAAQQLRTEMGLDLPAVRSALSDHLVERLTDLKDGLEYIEENLTSKDVMQGDAIRIMQIEDGDIEAIFSPELMRARPYPITMANVGDWTDRASALDGLVEKHALFAEFGAIEDCFEKLERKVREAVWQIDERANMR